MKRSLKYFKSLGPEDLQKEHEQAIRRCRIANFEGDNKATMDELWNIARIEECLKEYGLL